MKDHPPERSRPSASPRGRFEANLAIVLMATLAALYVLVDRSAESVRAAAPDLQLVKTNVFAAVGSIFGVVWLNFIFVRAETSLDMLRNSHVKAMKETSPRKAVILQQLMDHRARYVAAANLGSQLARLALVMISFLLAPALAQRLAPDYTYWTILLSALILLAPLGLFNLVIGELVPKSLGAMHPERVASLARFVRVAGVVFAPLAWLSTWVANVFTTRFAGARATFDVGHIAEEEIKSLVESAQESGAIEHDEKELLHSVFEFTDTVAREVMTPRVDLDAVSIAAQPADVIALIKDSGHSRIPIFEETDDQIVGIVHAKDVLLATLNNGSPVVIRDLMRPALFVPENKNLHELLHEMKSSRSHLAVVQDEFGGTSGIVTIEDIIEELVGDIQDEYDEESPAVVEDEHGFLVDGRTHLDDVNTFLGSELESEMFDTIGGYVFGLFGRQPRAGESIGEGNLRFEVVETDGRRIVKLRIQRVEGEPLVDELSDAASG